MPARTGAEYIKGLQEQEREVWLRRRARQGRDHAPRPRQRGARHRLALRHAARPRAARRDDVRLADQRRARRAVLHHPAHPGRAGAARRDDAALGAHDLRHDGPLAGLHERHLRRLGRGGRLLRAGPARVRREHPALLRVHPRERPDADALADQPAAQPHRRPACSISRRARRCRWSARPTPASSCAGRACWPRSGRSPTRSRSTRRAWRGTPRPTARSRSTSPSPAARRGCKFLCRESFDLGRSHFDHPLGSRFEEMDCVVFFDDVLVPWERVFLLGDVDLLNGTAHDHALDRAHRASGRGQEPRQVRVRARRGAADDGDARQRAPAAHRGAPRRADAVHRADEAPACAPPRPTRSSTSGA